MPPQFYDIGRTYPRPLMPVLRIGHWGFPTMKTTQGVSSSDRNSKRLRDGIQVTSLSPREEETLRLVTQGLTNKEIAVSLNIAVPTVNQFVNRLFLKTGVHNRTQLAVFAVQDMRLEKLLPIKQQARTGRRFTSEPPRQAKARRASQSRKLS